MALSEKIVTLNNIYVLLKMWNRKAMINEEGERILSNSIVDLKFKMDYVMQNCLKKDK